MYSVSIFFVNKLTSGVTTNEIAIAITPKSWLIDAAAANPSLIPSDDILKMLTPATVKRPDKSPAHAPHFVIFLL